MLKAPFICVHILELVGLEAEGVFYFFLAWVFSWNLAFSTPPTPIRQHLKNFQRDYMLLAGFIL